MSKPGETFERFKFKPITDVGEDLQVDSNGYLPKSKGVAGWAESNKMMRQDVLPLILRGETGSTFTKC